MKKMVGHNANFHVILVQTKFCYVMFYELHWKNLAIPQFFILVLLKLYP